MSDQTTAAQLTLPTSPDFVTPWRRQAGKKGRLSAAEQAAREQHERDQELQAQSLLAELERLRAIAAGTELLEQRLLGAEWAQDIDFVRAVRAERSVKDVASALKTLLQIVLGPDKDISVESVDASTPLNVTCTVGSRTIGFSTDPGTPSEVTLRTKNGTMKLSVLSGTSGLSLSLARAAHQVFTDGVVAPGVPPRPYQEITPRRPSSLDMRNTRMLGRTAIAENVPMDFNYESRILP